MKITIQLLILFTICFVAECIAKYLPFTFPSSISAMIILLIFLLIKLVKLDSISNITDFLIKNMPFFFIPAGVKIIDNFDYIKDCYGILLLIAFISFLVTFGATALTVGLITKFTKGGSN